MVPRAFVLILSIAVLSACVSGNNRDIGSRAPFNAYLGRTVTLLRPVYVFDNRGESLTMPRYSISDGPINSVPPDYGFCRLPVGHPVHLESVRLKVGFDSGAFPTALGHTFVPKLGKEVDFYYYWGFRQTLFRAPWEPFSVPDRRTINDSALLP
jgi:hypothetical protein